MLRLYGVVRYRTKFDGTIVGYYVVCKVERAYFFKPLNGTEVLVEISNKKYKGKVKVRKRQINVYIYTRWEDLLVPGTLAVVHLPTIWQSVLKPQRT